MEFLPFKPTMAVTVLATFADTDLQNTGMTAGDYAAITYPNCSDFIYSLLRGIAIDVGIQPNQTLLNPSTEMHYFVVVACNVVEAVRFIEL